MRPKREETQKTTNQQKPNQQQKTQKKPKKTYKEKQKYLGGEKLFFSSSRLCFYTKTKHRRRYTANIPIHH